MKKAVLCTVINICFSSIYPMAPLFRSSQRIAPCVRQTLNQGKLIPSLNKNIGYQSRHFFEPTTIAATAVGATASAYGLKKFYDFFINFRNQRSIAEAKNMTIQPQAYTSQNIQEMIRTIKNMPGYQKEDAAFGWYNFQNRELLNALTLTNIEKKYQNINLHLNPETWINYFEPYQLLEDIANANKYNPDKLYHGQNFIIPTSIMKGLVIINNNKDLKKNFISKMKESEKLILLSQSSTFYPAVMWAQAKLNVLREINEILGTEE